MKKLLLGIVALIALNAAKPLAAADLAIPYKGTVFTPAVYDWSGLYIGLNGGGGWSNTCWTNTSLLGTPANAAEGCHNLTGGMVGGQLGYRLQSAGWVYGLEVQGDWTDLKGSNASLAAATLGSFNNQSKLDAVGLFTGQVGYAWDVVLWYLKGGAAVTNSRYNGVLTSNGLAFDVGNETRWGGSIGTGVEFSFAPDWSVALEYDHVFLGTRNVNFTALNAPGTPVGSQTRVDSIKQDIDMATVRVNWRFGGPVIPKY